MANFFKAYQSEIRAKRDAETRKPGRNVGEYLASLARGQRVKVNRRYAESGYLYFADIINDNYILLSDDKTNAKAGRGWIYDESVIIF